MYVLLIPLWPAKAETWFSVMMSLRRRGGGMIISLLHANICVVVVENSSIRMSRIEFHDILTGENFEMESVCRFSSVATSRSERRHSRRSALSVWCVCVSLQGSKIKLCLPSFRPWPFREPGRFRSGVFLVLRGLLRLGPEASRLVPRGKQGCPFE